MKKTNEYVNSLQPGLFDRIPKAIWAAIAISYALNLRNAGDDLEAEIMNEWAALYGNGIVPQKPPK